MKQLQNNFTTPEQSKRLLELGVPADSADFYYDKDEVDIDERIQPYFIPLNRTFRNYDDRFYIPCYSVGRLIEIMLNCQIDTGAYTLGILLDKDIFNVESLIDIIDEDIEEFDFSKLEE